MPQPYRQTQPLGARVVGGLIAALVCWGTGYLVGDVLFRWAVSLIGLEAGLMKVADQGFFGALAYLALAIGVAIVGIPLVLIAGAISLGTKFYVLPALVFLSQLSPSAGGFVGAAGARAIRALGGLLTLVAGAAWSLPGHKTWRARLIDLSVVAVFVALVAGGWLVFRNPSAAAPQSSTIVEQRPTAFTREWHASVSPNVLTCVRGVSITPNQMAVTLHFQNRGTERAHFLLGNKLYARGGTGTVSLNAQQLASVAGDGRVPLRSAAGGTVDVVQIPPHGFVEGTYYFARPDKPRCFWEMSLRWAESVSPDPGFVPGWTIYQGSASFDLSERGFMSQPFGINQNPIRPALAVPAGAGGIRW